jgi:predicted ribonuclease YlaK
MAKPKSASNGFQFYFKPRGERQKEAVECWMRSRIVFLLGPSGVGKSAVALALAIQEALKPESRFKKIWLSRPLVQCDEDIGMLPGTLEDKLGPWLAPFRDCLGSLSTDKWDKLEAAIDVESVPVGMLRGRTIREGSLICDEFQNCTASQVKCALTRLGDYSRIVFCADPDQSDRFDKASQVRYHAGRKEAVRFGHRKCSAVYASRHCT